MFHGGTNFGFTAGGGDVGDIGAPDAYAVADITSYGIVFRHKYCSKVPCN